MSRRQWLLLWMPASSVGWPVLYIMWLATGIHVMVGGLLFYIVKVAISGAVAGICVGFLQQRVLHHRGLAYRLWLQGTTCGWILGSLFGMLVTVLPVVQELNLPATSAPTGGYLLDFYGRLSYDHFVLGGLLGGLGIGLGQWWVLRRWWSWALLWIPINALSWTGAWMLGFAVERILVWPWVVAWMLPGLLTGLVLYKVSGRAEPARLPAI